MPTGPSRQQEMHLNLNGPCFERHALARTLALKGKNGLTQAPTRGKACVRRACASSRARGQEHIGSEQRYTAPCPNLRARKAISAPCARLVQVRICASSPATPRRQHPRKNKWIPMKMSSRFLRAQRTCRHLRTCCHPSPVVKWRLWRMRGKKGTSEEEPGGRMLPQQRRPSRSLPSRGLPSRSPPSLAGLG